MSSQLQRMIVYGLGAGVVSFLVLAISTTIIPNPIFPREETVRTFDYVVLGIVTALAIGLGVTYAMPQRCPLQRNKLYSGGVLAFLAIGCPVCNVAVVALIGTGGAMAWFAPVQPLIGIAAIGMLSFALAIQIRDIRRAQSPPMSSTPARSTSAS
ncbi:MAG: hypothetical protein EA415_03730 [Sphaerobacteraceae bacterium]|nr:MAG: hypothetical protein EA415_03730 [Sphaerobacteraceae bacterium]